MIVYRGARGERGERNIVSAPLQLPIFFHASVTRATLSFSDQCYVDPVLLSTFFAAWIKPWIGDIAPLPRESSYCG